MVRKCAGSIGELVEGPMWCKKRNSLFFTDILNGTVFEYIPKTEKIQHWKLGTYVGCIIPGRDRDEMIAAVDDCLKVFHPEDGRAETLCRFPMADGIRFNDGKCGPGGQLWIGTMAVGGQKDRPAAMSMWRMLGWREHTPMNFVGKKRKKNETTGSFNNGGGKGDRKTDCHYPG